MSLNEELGDVLEEAGEVSAKLEEDLEASTGVAHEVKLHNADENIITYMVRPEAESLLNALSEEDESYYEDVNLDILGDYQFRVKSHSK